MKSTSGDPEVQPNGIALFSLAIRCAEAMSEEPNEFKTASL